MKIHLEHNGTVFEFERTLMPPERFNALCKLAETVICGAVLLALVHMLGMWGLVWAVGALVLVGLYRLIRGGMFD